MNISVQSKAVSTLIAMFLVLGIGSVLAQESSTQVNVLNYVRAKTTLHFDRVLMRSGSINRWGHVRQPIPLDQQKSPQRKS
jgi:hypothetical protein